MTKFIGLNLSRAYEAIKFNIQVFKYQRPTFSKTVHFTDSWDQNL